MTKLTEYLGTSKVVQVWLSELMAARQGCRVVASLSSRAIVAVPSDRCDEWCEIMASISYVRIDANGKGRLGFKKFEWNVNQRENIQWLECLMVNGLIIPEPNLWMALFGFFAFLSFFPLFKIDRIAWWECGICWSMLCCDVVAMAMSLSVSFLLLLLLMLLKRMRWCSANSFFG